MRLIVCGLGLFETSAAQPFGQLWMLHFPIELQLREWSRTPEVLMRLQKSIQRIESAE